MEGFGVINFERINKLKDVWAVLSRLCDYPTETTFILENRATLAENSALSPKFRQEILALFDELAEPSELVRESHYSELFELNRRYTLYMSYYKMTDSRERGTVLAKLKMLYEMFGITEVTSELSDYLPVLLEFFAYADFMEDDRQGDLQLALGVIEDGTYNLIQKAAADADDPYIKLIGAIRQLIKSCLVKEATENA